MNYIVTLAFIFTSFQLVFGQPPSKEDPFAEGSGPRNCNQIPWPVLINQNVILDGKLIRIQGWIKVSKVNNKLLIFLYQDFESGKANFKQSSIVLKVTDKTLNSYKNGSKEEWLKLDGRPVTMFGYFRFALDWMDGNPIGFFDEPIWILSEVTEKDQREELNIKTRGVKWR